MSEQNQSPNAVSPAPVELAGQPIVDRCKDVWDATFRREMARTRDSIGARVTANEAYRAAMPPLTGADNIRDFIACVAQGVLLRTIRECDAPRLLYAAQVAISALVRPAAQQAQKERKG